MILNGKNFIYYNPHNITLENGKVLDFADQNGDPKIDHSKVLEIKSKYGKLLSNYMHQNMIDNGKTNIVIFPIEINTMEFNAAKFSDIMDDTNNSHEIVFQALFNYDIIKSGENEVTVSFEGEELYKYHDDTYEISKPADEIMIYDLVKDKHYIKLTASEIVYGFSKKMSYYKNLRWDYSSCIRFDDNPTVNAEMILDTSLRISHELIFTNLLDFTKRFYDLSDGYLTIKMSSKVTRYCKRRIYDPLFIDTAFNTSVINGSTLYFPDEYHQLILGERSYQFLMNIEQYRLYSLVLLIHGIPMYSMMNLVKPRFPGDYDAYQDRDKVLIKLY